MKKYIYAILASILIIAPLKAKDIHVGAWTISEQVDEMTGVRTYYLISRPVKSTKPMGFPYEGTTAQLIVGCDKGDKWVYIYFSSAPNLLDTETKDGYSELETRMKFDDEIESVSFKQDWGSHSLVFEFPELDNIIPNLIRSRIALLELHWYGEGNVYFKFPLYGFHKALKVMEKKCSAHNK